MDKIYRRHVQVRDSQIGFVAVSTWILPIMVMTTPWMSVMSCRKGRTCLVDRLRREWDSWSNLLDTMSLRCYMAHQQLARM
jgi:hypothetical protein